MRAEFQHTHCKYNKIQSRLDLLLVLKNKFSFQNTLLGCHGFRILDRLKDEELWELWKLSLYNEKPGTPLEKGFLPERSKNTNRGAKTVVWEYFSESLSPGRAKDEILYVFF